MDILKEQRPGAKKKKRGRGTLDKSNYFSYKPRRSMTKPLSKKFVPLIGILCMLSYHSLFLYFFSSELKQFPKAVKLEKTAAQVIHTEDGGSCIFFQVLSLLQYSELCRFTI